MNAQQYKIVIPKPCHEDWNKMNPNEKGRHCNSCAKTVVDFSTWADEDILKYLQKSKGNTCGRLSNTQLSRSYSHSSFFEKFIYKKLLKAAAFLILLLKMKRTEAQVGKVARAPIVEPVKKEICQTKGEAAVLPQNPDTTKDESMYIDGMMQSIPVVETMSDLVGDTTIMPDDSVREETRPRLNADGVPIKTKVTEETIVEPLIPFNEQNIIMGGAIVVMPITDFGATWGICTYLPQKEIIEIDLRLPVSENKNDILTGMSEEAQHFIIPELPQLPKKIPTELGEKVNAVLNKEQEEIKPDKK
jgi:hypothetical protein